MDFPLLQRVSNTPGIPGFEDAIQDVAAEVLGGCCDEVRRDNMGNVIALKKATRPPESGRPLRVVLAAHADEIGMMVKHIGDDGFIRFQPMGGLNAQVLVSQPVLVHGRKPVRGVIVPAPAGKDAKPPAPTDLFIDVGLPKEEVTALVAVGDVVTFTQEVMALNDKVYMGRNFDDRIGTYCLLDAMRTLGETSVDAYAVSSVQEEVGLRGIPSAVFTIDPDIGIAIDGSLAIGPHAKPPDKLCAIGKGTGIYLVDGLTIGNPRLVKFLFEVGEKHGIPCQKNIGGGTDASAMQKVGRGAMATTIGAPVRYMHSTVQLCHADDIEATVRLLARFLESAHELLTVEG